MPANFFKKTSLSRNILLKITLQRNNENQHASLDSSLIQQRMVGSVKNIFMLPALSYYDFSLRLSDNHLLSSNFFFGISLTLQTLCNRVAAAKWTSTTRKTLVWTYTTALKRAKTMLTSRKKSPEKKIMETPFSLSWLLWLENLYFSNHSRFENNTPILMIHHHIRFSQRKIYKFSNE